MANKYVAFKRPEDRKLMKLFLKDPDHFRKILITDNQINTLEVIKEHFCNAMTARNLADWKNISIQSASTQLTNLWHTGYIERRAISDETGGIRHLYKVVDLSA